MGESAETNDLRPGEAGIYVATVVPRTIWGPPWPDGGFIRLRTQDPISHREDAHHQAREPPTRPGTGRLLLDPERTADEVPQRLRLRTGSASGSGHRGGRHE